MDLIIPAFFMIFGIYYLIIYSSKKGVEKIVSAYGEEISKQKVKRGKFGGVILLILSVLGFVLAFFK